MSGGRIVALVFGCLIGLLGLVLFIGGIAVAIAYGVARDDDGFFRTDEILLTTTTAAITSENLDFGGAPGNVEWLTTRGDFATVRVELEPTGSSGELFAGIGPTADVTTYLTGVAHDRVDDFNDTESAPTYERQEGSATATPPGDETFWVEQITTAEPSELTWDVESGDWTVVVMNADGSSGIDADARVGIKLDWLLPVAIGFIVVGFILLAGGTVLAVFAARVPRQQAVPAAAGPSTMPPPPTTGTAPPPPPAGPSPSSVAPPPTGPPPTTPGPPPDQPGPDRNA